MNFEEFMKENNLFLDIGEDHSQEKDYHAKFLDILNEDEIWNDNKEETIIELEKNLQGKITITRIYGSGNSIDEAIDDYINLISGGIFIISSTEGEKRRILIPILKKEKPYLFKPLSF